MKAAKRVICLMLVLGLMLCSVPGGHAAGNQKLPNALFLTQEVSGTCTLSSAAMMIRSCMYINGNENWYFVTENGLKPTAWVTGTGLRWSFQYTVEGATTSIGHRTIGGISASSLKALLDEHPEGIVLYCGKIPHAVFLTGYEGDTFYCADTVEGYSGRQIPVAASWLGVKYGTQAKILKNVTAYWYVTNYQDTGSGATCDCDSFYAGTYQCTTTTSDLLIRAGHGTSYPVVGSIPAGANVTVTKASDGWAHVIYNGIGGYASMQYLRKVADAHSYETTVYAPTCEEPGYTHHVCTECGYSYQDTPVDALGHAYGEWTASSVAGQEIRTCSHCGDTQTRQVETALMGTVTGSDLRIRAGAGTSYSVVGHLQMGDRVTILEQKTVDSMVWGRIEQGWICMDYVQLDPEDSDFEPVTGTVINSDSLRIRKAPSFSAAIMGYLYRGNSVTILEIKTVDGARWGRIANGWIAMDYIRLEEPAPEPEDPIDPPQEPETVTGTVFNTDSLRIRKDTSFSAAIMGYLYRGNQVQILEIKTVNGTQWGRIANGWIAMEYIRLEEPTPEPEDPVVPPEEPTPDPEEPQTIIGTVVNTDNLRIRKDPSLSAAIVGYVYRGNQVQILEIKVINGAQWGRIANGWISMDYIRRDEAAIMSGTVVNTDNLRIRKDTSFSAAIVGYVYRGDRVEILEIKVVDGTRWGRIANGWISMDYVI